MKTTSKIFSLMIAFVLITGCADKSAKDKSDDTSTTEQVAASEFVLTSEPLNANSVLALRESAKDADDVVIVGRIGGSTHPFVDGVAAFTIVDASLPSCGDEEECDCPTPWDYCCETAEDIIKHSATIKFVDADSRPRRFDPRQVFAVKELQTVIVQGKASRDEAGNLTVLAEKIFVKE